MGTLSYGFLSYLCNDNKICKGIEIVTWGLDGNKYFISVPVLFYLLLLLSLFSPDTNLNRRACNGR